jgi:death-on-curing protein
VKPLGEALFLEVDDIVRLHHLSLDALPGLPGVRDPDALLGAIAAVVDAAPASLFHYAAVYAYRIARDQPFYEQNERTALLVALSFLLANECEPPEFDEQHRLWTVMPDVASGALNLAVLTELFESAFDSPGLN